MRVTKHSNMKNHNLTADIESAKALINNGYSTIIVDPYYVGIAKMITEFFCKFTKLPKEMRKAWEFDVGMIGKPDTGYLRRDDAEAKHFLHHHYFLKDLLAHRNVLYTDFKPLLDCLESVHRYAEGRVKEFAKALDIVLPEYEFFERLSTYEASMQSVFRALQYDHCRVELEETAESHEDQSLFTLAFYETHKGLYLKTLKNLYQPEEGRALIFGGKKVQLITGGKETFVEKDGFRLPKIEGGIIQALTHGVISLPSLYGDDYERQSGVLFTHDPTTSLTPKTKIVA